jgi:prophage tail gpP-like protein
MPRNAAALALVVDGVEYRDIKRATVEMALDQFADTVSVEMSDAWALQSLALTFPFEEGASFDFTVDGEIWVTGFVTSLPISYNADDHSVAMEGLSWGGNLTTSSHLEPRVWRDAPLDRIVNDVARPYGLGVVVESGVDLGEPFRRFAAGVGETSYEVIRRAASKRGLWVTCGGNESDVTILKVGSERYSTVIVGGRVPGRECNVLAGSRSASILDRHDEIIVVGQSGEHSDWSGDQATYGLAVAKDFGVNIFRPLVIHEPSESGAKKLQRRADWEVRTRAGKARRLDYTLQGYLAENEPDGAQAWRANRRIQVLDELLDVDDELLIERVRVDFVPDGTTTSLSLVAPQAYDQLAPPPRSKTLPRGRKGQFVAWG